MYYSLIITDKKDLDNSEDNTKLLVINQYKGRIKYIKERVIYSVDLATLLARSIKEEKDKKEEYIED